MASSACARRPLPPTLNVGYANWGECDDKIVQAATQGVNVLIWFAVELVLSDQQRPLVHGGPNLTCVANVAASLRARNLSTHHFISVGGWNAPHPTASGGTVDEWYQALEAYQLKAQAAGLPGGFDGLDWDLEGNDSPTSPWNTFAAADLRLVAQLSTRIKQSGRFVSLAPPQSYLDCTTPDFSLSVGLPARCWHPEFTYAGRSVYAALLALAPADTYDFVSLQLYESWSLAACALYLRHEPPGTYLRALVRGMDAGWRVPFARAPSLGLPNASVRVPADKLVLGIANGWTRAGAASKALFLPPAELAAAWARLAPKPRGVMFWDIGDEGEGKPPLFMARALNSFLHTRG